jgi:hypothetical protein
MCIRQEFSAEDEPDEVEEDQRARTASSVASTAFSGARRRSQGLRRRTTQSVLPNAQGDLDEESSEHESSTMPQSSEQPDAEVEEGTMRAESYEPSDAGSVNSFTLKVVRSSLRYSTATDSCLGSATSYQPDPPIRHQDLEAGYLQEESIRAENRRR